MSPAMDLRQLRYFMAIVEQGSFSRAAEMLGVAQPALSLHVRHMEAELGTPLLVRSPQGVVATEAGVTASPIHPAFPSRYAAAYAAQLDHFADVLHGRAVPRVGYDDGVAALVLAEACARSLQRGAAVTP